MTANVYKVSVWDDENVRKFTVVLATQLCDVPTPCGFHTLSG
jgi:hypothetical protein